MRLQIIFAITLFALTTVSVSATAAIINQVDYPDTFITAKEKVVTSSQASEQISASDVQK